MAARPCVMCTHEWISVHLHCALFCVCNMTMQLQHTCKCTCHVVCAVCRVGTASHCMVLAAAACWCFDDRTCTHPAAALGMDRVCRGCSSAMAGELPGLFCCGKALWDVGGTGVHARRQGEVAGQELNSWPLLPTWQCQGQMTTVTKE